MEYIMKEKYEILKLAGVLNESLYEKLLEHDLQRGQKVKVSWSEGRRGIIGEIEGVHKIAFPERGKEGRCCFFHFQECIFKFDTKPADENSGAIIVDPGVCAGCRNLHNLIPHDFEYRVDKNAVFLRYKGKEEKVETRRASQDINDYVKYAVDKMKNSTSFEDTVAKLRSGEIEIPKYPGEVMAPPESMNPKNHAIHYLKYEFNIFSVSGEINSINPVISIPNVYGPFAGYEVNKNLVVNELRQTSVYGDGGEYLSSDERGYRSNDGYTKKELIKSMDFDEWKESILKKRLDKWSKPTFDKVIGIVNRAPEVVDETNSYQAYKLKYLDFQEDYYNWAKNLPEEKKELFKGNSSHEFRSPMQIIFGFDLPYPELLQPKMDVGPYRNQWLNESNLVR